ncbi:MAG: hypothetical protein Tsb002_24000 [Wenzhouxiangellaceae bacterium]
MASYTQQQIIYALNSIANAPSGRHGSVAQLEAYATEVVTRVFEDPGVIDLIGEWQLVWGPAVYQVSSSTVADNAMYVAQNKNQPNEFVVAISGTNPISAYGWIVEDIEINPPVTWPYGDASPSVKGEITQGTNVGLNVLLNILNSGGQSLSEYLASQVSASPSALSITVTGHSLGGALSPATALALLDTQGIPLGQANGWDPDSKSSISVTPTAGPTPGNKTWRDYYDGRLGAATDRLWNAIDIVPHAWQISMLDQIPTIYEPTIPQNQFVSTLVSLAKLNSLAAGNLEQIRPDVAGLPGTVDTSITISVQNLIVIIETLQVNKLIYKLAAKLSLSPDELALITAVIDDYIKHLNSQPGSALVTAPAALSKLQTKNTSALESTSSTLYSSLITFIDFLIQAAHQHTVAYAELLGTQAYADIVSAIEEEIG